MRQISWVKAARKEFETFPEEVRRRMGRALEIAGLGGMAESAKPLKGFDGGIFEIAIPFRKDAYRAVYAVKIGEDIWVIHAFQKKSKQGIKTPQNEIELIHGRIRFIKSQLR
jgi:phage-related protein